MWLDEVIEKIESEHQVTKLEAEEVFDKKFKCKKMRRGRFRGEHVYRALGRTKAGRYLSVFFIYKKTHEALILSARDMDKKERKSYAKKQKTNPSD